MLKTYACHDGQLAPALDDSVPAIWYDLLNPTIEEDRLVEQRLGISIPTQGEMEEIELSARLYHEDGAEFMTVTAVLNLNRRARQDARHLHSQGDRARHSPLRRAEGVLRLRGARAAA
jgi:Mg2+ and Co2+ transporter CorA